MAAAWIALAGVASVDTVWLLLSRLRFAASNCGDVIFSTTNADRKIGSCSFSTWHYIASAGLIKQFSVILNHVAKITGPFQGFAPTVCKYRYHAEVSSDLRLLVVNLSQPFRPGSAL